MIVALRSSSPFLHSLDASSAHQRWRRRDSLGRIQFAIGFARCCRFIRRSMRSTLILAHVRRTRAFQMPGDRPYVNIFDWKQLNSRRSLSKRCRISNRNRRDVAVCHRRTIFARFVRCVFCVFFFNSLVKTRSNIRSNSRCAHKQWKTSREKRGKNLSKTHFESLCARSIIIASLSALYYYLFVSFAVGPSGSDFSFIFIGSSLTIDKSEPSKDYSRRSNETESSEFRFNTGAMRRHWQCVCMCAVHWRVVADNRMMRTRRNEARKQKRRTKEDNFRCNVRTQKSAFRRCCCSFVRTHRQAHADKMRSLLRPMLSSPTCVLCFVSAWIPFSISFSFTLSLVATFVCRCSDSSRCSARISLPLHR